MFSAWSLVAAALLILTVLGQSPQDDPAYQLFAMQIESQLDEVQSKFNHSKEAYENITNSFNLKEFESINETLRNCYNDLVKKYNNTEPFCMQSVEQDVLNIISDSENELAACTNLTYSLKLVGQLITDAVPKFVTMKTLVDEMLTDASKCVTKTPALKIKCINYVGMKYSDQWNNAKSLAEEACSQISGGSLLLLPEVINCQVGENSTLDAKCQSIESEILLNCITTPSP